MYSKEFSTNAKNHIMIYRVSDINVFERCVKVVLYLRICYKCGILFGTGNYYLKLQHYGLLE